MEYSTLNPNKQTQELDMNIKIASWNIQMAKGADAIRDLNRIIDYIKAQDADIICLQEVGRNLPELLNSQAPDQLIALSIAFRNYFPVWAPGLSWNLPSDISHSRRRGDNRLEFGNLTLVRNELVDKKIHSLPLVELEEQELAGEPIRGKSLPKSIGRAVPEVVIPLIGATGKTQFVRILNVHLAYHNKAETLEQFKYLHRWQVYNHKMSKNKVQKGDGIFSNPYITDKAIICGDFNMSCASKNYQYMLDSGWEDAWTKLHSDKNRLPTCGIYDTDQWQEGAHTRDYFIYQNLEPVKMTVDTKINFSDHQPIFLEFKL